MTVANKLHRLLLALCLASCAGVAYAAEPLLDLSLPQEREQVQAARPFLLAANDVENASVGRDSSAVTQEAFEPKLFSGSKMHQYLGVGTAVFAAAAFMTHPHPTDPNAPRETNGTHAQLAKATVAMAAATVATGLYTHWDDFSMEDGWSDPDNLHVLLGATGAALMAYATVRSANSSVPVSHAAMSELGALGMVIAIKLTW